MYLPFRSFEIDNLGIYNWDKIYKAPSAIQLVADFKFESSEDLQNINFFLVTGNQKNVIIKYSYHNLKNFYFESNLNNQIIAILPNNRVATFTQEEFAKLNYDKIRREKRYTFHIKKINKVEGMKDFKAIVKS